MNLHQVGTAEESTYGTPVVVDRFYPFLPGESLERRQNVVVAQGLRTGTRVRRGSERALTSRDAGGSIAMEVTTKAFGRWFKHALGGTPSIAQQAATAAYLQTFTPGALPTGLTVQKGVEKWDGTVQPLTFHGGKVASWELRVGKDGLAIFEVEMDFEDVDKTTGLAAASYGALEYFTFADATVEKDDVDIAAVTNVVIRGRNQLAVDRFYLGTAGLKAEPVETALREVTGVIEAEFRDMATFYDAFAGDTALKLDVDFVASLIEGAYSNELHFSLDNVRLTGDTPKIADEGPAKVSVPFVATADDDGTWLTATYQSTDTAV